jgi:phospholipase C
MTYKVGDRVVIHSLSWFEKNCISCGTLSSTFFNKDFINRCGYVHDMHKYFGKIVTIKSVDNYNSDDRLNSYNINGDYNKWNFYQYGIYGYAGNKFKKLKEIL